MVLDIIFVIFAAYGFYLGYAKGIIGTVFTVLAYILGLIAGIKFAPSMTTMLEDLFSNNNPLMFFAGFLLSFVLVMIIIRTLAKGLEGVLKTAHINVINKIIGGAFLMGMMIVMNSVLIWFADSAHLIDQSTKDTSITYPHMKPLPGQAFDVTVKLKPVFKDFWDEAIHMMDRLQGVSLERSEGDASIFDIPDEPKEKPKQEEEKK